MKGQAGLSEPVGMVAPRHLVIQILDQIFRSRSFADQVLDSYLRRKKLSPQDRALACDLVYGILRWQKWLDWVLQKTYHGNWVKVPKKVRFALEIGLYQILFLDRVPDHAAVNESVEIAVEAMGTVWGRVVNAMLREILRRPELLVPPDMEADPIKAIAVKWSHPEWLVKKWIDLWGVERTLSLCRANNERPSINIRINRMKTDRATLHETLLGLDVQAKSSQLLDDFLILEKGGTLLQSDLFREGFVSVQDVSAGLVAVLMDPRPGDRIVDLAAAPGGKSMYMAELTGDRAIIMAVDNHHQRIKKVRENQKRLGLRHIHPVVADGRDMGSRQVDKVLVDVPCSGLGVIRRRGELRWRRQPDDIIKIVEHQKALLKAGAGLVKPDGVLVYSTCTILPEENENVLEDFLDQHPHFTVDDARRFVPPRIVNKQGFIQTWPDRHGIDGSFAVRLKRMR